MKTFLFNFFACLSLVLMASCGGSSSERRIAELEDSIANLNKRIVNAQSESVNSSNAEITDIADNAQSNTVAVNESSMDINPVGEYEVVDKSGRTAFIKINEDNTATLKIDEVVYYGSWEFWFDCDDKPMLSFDDELPKINFPGGIERLHFPLIADGYIYEHYDRYKSKNPQKRLPIKKVK